jgi:hypothetical protein
MKPVPTSEFNVDFVDVKDEKWNVPETAQYFERIFTATLNYSIFIEFIPEINRTVVGWPPKFNVETVDCETSDFEARIISLYTGSYIATPNENLAGQEELIPTPRVLCDPYTVNPRDIVIFYVTPQEFMTFSQNKDELIDTPFFLEERDKIWNITNIKKYAIGQFICERFLKSKYVREYDAYILGQLAVSPWERKAPIQV